MNTFAPHPTPTVFSMSNKQLFQNCIFLNFLRQNCIMQLVCSKEQTGSAVQQNCIKCN